MARTPTKPGQTAFRRRIPLELRGEEYELLEREAARFGTKRATLVAGLEALGRFAGLEHEAGEARDACATAEANAEKLTREVARLERDLAKVKANAAEAAKKRSATDRKGAKASADARRETDELTALLREAERERASLEDELVELEAELLDALRCPRCDRWATPSEWATRNDGEYELVYHRACGFHRGGLASATSILGYRERG